MAGLVILVFDINTLAFWFTYVEQITFEIIIGKTENLLWLSVITFDNVYINYCNELLL